MAESSALLKIETDKLGEVRDVAAFLDAVEKAYDGLYTLGRIVNDAAHGGKDPEVRRAFEDVTGIYEQTEEMRVASISYQRLLVPPEERLRLTGTSVHSPGAWEFRGAVNVLETICKWVVDGHERQANKEHGHPPEEEMGRLRVEQAATEVAREAMAMLQSAGFPEVDMNGMVRGLVIKPPMELNGHQTAGRVRSATIQEHTILRP